MRGYGNRVLALIVAALLPVVLLGSAMVYNASDRERERIEADSRIYVERVVEALDRRIASHIQALEVLAASSSLDGADLNAFRAHAGRVLAEQPFWRNIILAGADGFQLANIRFPEAPMLVRVGDADSFAEVLRTGRPQVGGVGPGPYSGRLAVIVRVPVRRAGETRYVLTAALDLGAVAGLLDQVLPKSWAGAIIDRAGRIVARRSDGGALAGSAASQEARTAVTEHREGQFRRSRSREGSEYMAIYLYSPVTGWTVHAGIPYSAFSVLRTKSVAFAAGGAAAGVVLAGLLSWLLVRELRARRRQESALLENQHLEALGRIAGGIAHDFNNVLMIVQSGARSIIRRSADPVAVTELAEGLLGGVKRGSALTRQLLTYARRGAYRPTTFALQDRAKDLLVLFRQATRGNIETSLSVPETTWPIHADPDVLDVALINLATNARDAMPNGGTFAVAAANVTLGDGRDDGTALAGEYVVISVSDTGAGIPRGHLPHVFEPFFTTKEMERGTGLGLSQVYGFAKQSGGAITVSSVVGEGSIFKLYLPRSREAARPAAARGPAETHGLAGGHVLLVEDSPEVSGAVESMLRSAGYTIDIVRNANAATGLLAQGRVYDVVLSDIVMAGAMSGLDLAAYLRQHHPGLPIVLMTGYSDVLARGNIKGLRVLSKPFFEDEMVAALEQARSEQQRASV